MEYINKKPIIYLIYGKAKHGKDTFSNFLKNEFEQQEKKVIITQLSKYIKYYAKEITGWNLDEETKPREFLQNLGTKLIREQLNKDEIFINRMIDDIEIFSYFYDVIIISDIRLRKEIDMLKQSYPNTKIIKVLRPDFDNGLSEEQKKHITEIDLDNYENYDFSINNTSFAALRENAEKIYAKSEKGV